MTTKLKRRHYMVEPKQIDKLKKIKVETGASASHSVRKAVDQYKPVKFRDNGR